MVKVVWVHSIIAPYRVPFLIALSQHPEIDLSVYYCARTHKHRKWEIMDSSQYRYRILPGLTVQLSGIICSFNPGILRALGRERPDAVVIGGCSDATMLLTFAWARASGIPVILASEDIERPSSLLRRVANTVAGHVVRRAGAVVVPGTRSRDFHIKLGAAREKVFIAPNAVDNEAFMLQSQRLKKQKAKLKQRLNINEARVIIYVGRLVRDKGLNYLVEAYRRLRGLHDDICLVLAGDGPLREELEETCARDGTRGVYFAGNQSQSELVSYYAAADLFVLPTLRDVWGLTVNEAMACGLPVITTRASGCAPDLVIPGENGFIVEAADAGQLSLAMEKVVLDKALAARMGRRSLQIIRDFTIDRRVAGYLTALKHVTGAKTADAEPVRKRRYDTGTP
jgi:glycosyltransferase involved in cell wall biosynthesis